MTLATSGNIGYFGIYWESFSPAYQTLKFHTVNGDISSYLYPEYRLPLVSCRHSAGLCLYQLSELWTGQSYSNNSLIVGEEWCPVNTIKNSIRNGHHEMRFKVMLILKISIWNSSIHQRSMTITWGRTACQQNNNHWGHPVLRSPVDLCLRPSLLWG